MGKGRLPILQTRFIGYTQHASGHVLAPPDLVFEVFECEEVARRPHIPLSAKVWAVGVLLGCGFFAARLLYWLATGVDFFPSPFFN